MGGRSFWQRSVTVMLLLAILAQVASVAITVSTENRNSQKVKREFASQLIATDHATDNAVESNIAVPTVIARVGCIDSRACEPNENASEILVGERGRAPRFELSDKLALDGCTSASHRTLVNLNVRLQI